MIGYLGRNYWNLDGFPAPAHPSANQACATLWAVLNGALARWVGVIRWRAKPRPHGFLAPLYYEGRCLEADLLHGIPHRPPLLRRPSKASIRRCNSSMICCNRAITANGVSRLAVLRATVVDSNRSLALSSDLFVIQP